MDLQNSFYVLGIVFMSLMLIILIAMVAAVFTIKARINLIQRQLEDKFRTATDAIHMGEALFDTAKKVVNRSK